MAVYGAGSGGINSQIRFLLDEETSLRQKLEARLESLRQRSRNLNNTITPCSCPNNTAPPPKTQVAYVGTQQPTMSSLTSNSVFNFSSDVINVGQAFNPKYAHFNAPVSGIYGFSLAAYMSPRYTVVMELVLDGTPIMYVKTGHYTSRQVNMGTNFVLVNMTKDQEVWPKYVSGSRYLWGGGISTFSGVLLYEL